MQVNKAYTQYIKEYKYWYGFTHEVADNSFIEMHFYNSDFDGFARWVLYGGNNYRIIHPPLLQEKVLTLVQQLCNWYNIDKID
ncbi:MAG: hypothetical protein IPO21_06165 [Bacteroidales bacterium]|nr:hypothetical protein [Bacteroidales bacterium]